MASKKQMTVANGVAVTLLENTDFWYQGDTQGEGWVGWCFSRPFGGIRKLGYGQAKQGGVEAHLRFSTEASVGEGVDIHVLPLADIA